MKPATPDTHCAVITTVFAMTVALLSVCVFAADFELITSPPVPGAVVYIDGVMHGTTGDDGTSLVSVEPGVREVTLVGPDGQSREPALFRFEEGVGVAAGEVLSEVAPSICTIETNVPLATVSVNGVPVATTSEPDARVAVVLSGNWPLVVTVSREDFNPASAVLMSPVDRLTLVLTPVEAQAEAYLQEREPESDSDILPVAVAALSVLATGMAALVGVRRHRPAALSVLATGMAALVRVRRRRPAALSVFATGMAAMVGTRRRRPQEAANPSLSDAQRPAPSTLPQQPAPKGEFAFDRYRVAEQIGIGGIATIYRAVDSIDGSTVALKLLDPRWLSDGEIVRKFLAESWALETIRGVDPDAAVVRCLRSGREGGRDDGQPFIALELLRGDTVEGRINSRKTFEEWEAVLVAAQVAGALIAVHRSGIIHRDLTPDNIFLLNNEVRIGEVSYAGGPRAVLIDFGVARQETLPWATMDGSIMGKPHYMSPEHSAGDTLDGRSDLYALGAVLFAMITGGPPFSGNLVDVIRGQQKERPPSLHGRCSAGLAALVARLLQKDPDDRPSSAREVAAELRELLETTAPHSQRRQATRERKITA